MALQACELRVEVGLNMGTGGRSVVDGGLAIDDFGHHTTEKHNAGFYVCCEVMNMKDEVGDEKWEMFSTWINHQHGSIIGPDRDLRQVPDTLPHVMAHHL